MDYPFLQNSARNDIRWYKNEGPDFDVFYGRLKDSKSAGVGFYRGGHPSFRTSEDETIVKGKLRAFPVDWYEKRNDESPRIYRKALIPYKKRVFEDDDEKSRYTEFVHVWVYGDSEGEVDQLTRYMDGLKLFTEKPVDKIQRDK